MLCQGPGCRAGEEATLGVGEKGLELNREENTLPKGVHSPSQFTQISPGLWWIGYTGLIPTLPPF